MSKKLWVKCLSSAFLHFADEEIGAGKGQSEDLNPENVAPDGPRAASAGGAHRGVQE